MIIVQGREILQSTVDLVHNNLNLEVSPCISTKTIYGYSLLLFISKFSH